MGENRCYRVDQIICEFELSASSNYLRVGEGEKIGGLELIPKMRMDNRLSLFPDIYLDSVHMCH